MLSIGLGTYIGLFLIGIPFALPLAILAGILEIIPILGPIVSAIPAIIIGFGISPVIGVAVTAVAFLVHQLEGYVLVPKIMEKSVGVSPLVVLVAITIGAKLLGVVGVIISVPFVITLQVLAKEYFLDKE
jgi:predicted PurR-regulated permease PerM